MTHLSSEQLRQWRDAPTEAARATVVGHLAVCDQCTQRYAELIRTRPLGDARPTLQVADFVVRGLESAAFRPVTGTRNLTSRLALAAAVLLAVGVSSWQVFEGRRLRSQLVALEAERQTREQEVAQQARVERSRGDQLDRELQEERKTRALLEQELARQRDVSLSNRPVLGPVLSLFLTPGRLRGTGETKTITIAPDAAEVRLMLAVEGQGTYRSYQVEILNSEGVRVWTRAGVQAGQQIVIVTVPAKVFAEDDYELALRGVTANRETERAGQYFFTVLK